MNADRATRLHRLARTLIGRFDPGLLRHGGIEAAWSRSARSWALVWTDGPTVAQIRATCRQSDPQADQNLRYVRTLSEDAVALGVIRLTLRPATPTSRRTVVRPADVEVLLRDTPFPAPRTERERALVYALLYEIHDAHHQNQARPEEICDFVNQYGLAVLLRRCATALSPVEVLTAHYAASHAHPAWRYQLTPMEADALFRAVHEDSRASVELVAAALALLPELPGELTDGGDELRARLESADLKR